MISASMFRMYDIRGIVDEALTEPAVEQIGLALGSAVLAAGDSAIVLARDGRLSGPRLHAQLLNGLLETGLNVIDIGEVPTPLAYFAAATLDGVNSCVVLTGSHNPPNYNGIKMVIQGVTLYGDAIQALYQRIEQQDFVQGLGERRCLDIVPTYIAAVQKHVPLGRPLSVVVDAGNGVAGPTAVALLRALGCEVIELFCDVDGHFPNHHPDPAKAKNLQDLIAAVHSHQADLGIAFDGDGDRCGIVDNQGQVLDADRQLMLYAQEVLNRQPGAEIIYDIKCSALLPKLIEQAGGKATIWKTGHSFMKAKMRETGAALGGEVSGHIFWKDRWYGFDDGLYTAARMLEILANSSETAAELFAKLPKGINTPELEMAFAEGEHYAFYQAFKAQAEFPEEAHIFDLDGLRVDFSDGWGLIRPSNTSPVITLRFEGDSDEALERIQCIFKTQIQRIQPDLILPF